MWQALINKIMYHTLQSFAHIFAVYIVCLTRLHCDIVKAAIVEGHWAFFSAEERLTQSQHPTILSQGIFLLFLFTVRCT